MNHEIIDTYLDLIAELDGGEPDVDVIRGLLSEVESDANLDSAGQALLRGYMGYHFQEVITQVDCEAEFRLVLNHAPDHHLANLHLGYQTFDTGNYVTALEQFQKIDLNKHYLWSQIKIRELIIACNLQLGQFTSAEKKLPFVLGQAMNLTIQEYALPTELIRALAENAAAFQSEIGAASYDRCFTLVNEVMQKHDLFDLFQEQLAQIQAIPSSAVSKEAESDETR